MEPPIIVDAVNPGLCDSQLRRHWPLMMRIRTFLYINLLARTTEAGSRTLIWAATGVPHRELDLHGKYLSDNQVLEPSDFVLSVEGMAMQRKIWVGDPLVYMIF